MRGAGPRHKDGGIPSGGAAGGEEEKAGPRLGGREEVFGELCLETSHE